MTGELGPVTKLLRGPEPQPPTGGRSAATPIFGQFFGPIMINPPNLPKTEIMCALLVASGLRNSYMNFIQIGQK